MRKVITKKANKSGQVFALIGGDDGFEVWKLCENYSIHVKGGVAKSWRYVEKKMSEQSAKALFDRRTA